ncbi:unnamed protein product [Blumeria hordei]|uniref:Cytochrome b5 heme-binding domain-containing protein n=1 Tax=Blumeria hordei TaxID=2867405 RepID=A0A383UNL2_BLUHO|nr:unnamed protein product [Blumeria hordei]
MSGKFEPRTPTTLQPPKDDPITLDELRRADGQSSSLHLASITDGRIGVQSNLCYVAIKGKVFDVSGNKAYLPDGSYHVFAGRDASRALARTSVKIEDVRPEWEDLDAKEKKTLDDWMIFFSKRYNVVGIVTAEGSKV